MVKDAGAEPIEQGAHKNLMGLGDGSSDLADCPTGL
jgi:hypothetical protein